MPKARKHPHHHSVAERRARASGAGWLKLPQWRMGVRGPVVQPPPGWDSKTPAEAIFGAAQGCRMLGILVGALVVGFVVIVLLAQIVK